MKTVEWLYTVVKIKEIKTREMPIYDRNESIITDKLSFVKSKREKNSKYYYRFKK
mgnify:CR=1 FL=1